VSTQTQSAPSTTGMEMRLVMEAAEKGRLHDGKDSNDLAARTASGLAYATAARGWPAEDLGSRPVTAAAIAAALGDARSEGRYITAPVFHLPTGEAADYSSNVGTGAILLPSSPSSRNVAF
jgi:hypothetical protein